MPHPGVHFDPSNKGDSVRRNEFALLCISMLIALAIAEFAVRVFLALPAKAIAMTTLPSIVGEQGDVVRYKVNTQLVEVAVDQDGIIYSAAFDTNNLGLIDDQDYGSSEADQKIALLGDSFTAGYHGGSPWILEFRKRLDESTSANNLGVAGTGIREFEKRLKWFANELELDKVFVLVISSDFYRPEWYPVIRDRKLWFCPSATESEQCLVSSNPAFHDLDAGWTNTELLSEAQSILNAGSVTSRRGLRLFDTSISAFRSMRETPAMRLTYPEVRANLAALDRLVKWFGVEKVVVLHLPEKHEVARNGYDIDLRQYASEQSIQYTQLQEVCPFNSSMYLDRDPHPNTLGYTHLVDCLAGLALPPAGSSRAE